MNRKYKIYSGFIRS